VDAGCLTLDLGDARFNPVNVHIEPLRTRLDQRVAAKRKRQRRLAAGQPNLFDDAERAVALVKRHQDLEYPYHCTFGVARLRIDEGVFCPALTNVSPFLLRHVDFLPGEHVLDAFAGSGAFGIQAALLGCTAVSVDVDPLACASAKYNVSLNGVKRLVDVSCMTLDRYAADAVQRFNLVVANPPLLPGRHEGGLGAALYDPEHMTTVDFIESLPRLLTHDGRCYVITSDVLERYGYNVERISARAGLMARLVAETDLGYETYRVHRIHLDPWTNSAPERVPDQAHRI
jgi:methylase of polypeptide subunit release factors